MPPTPISDQVRVLRRIPPARVVRDHNVGDIRPASGNFIDAELSVMVEDDLIESGRPIEEALEGHDTFGLVALVVGQVKAMGLDVIRDERDDEPAHALVIGNKTKTVRRAMAKASDWVIRPKGVELGS